MNNSISDKSPENIAEIIFNEDPKPENSIQLELNNTEFVFIFEILITILLEGFKIKYSDLKNINSNSFNENYILNFNPFFKSMGFNINVNKYEKKNRDDYKNYYCKVVLRDNEWGGFFELKNINKDYHFFINPDYIYENNFNKMNDVGCIFIFKENVYLIKFNFLNQ